MDVGIFDFKFKNFNIKNLENIRWHVHSSKFYEIYKDYNSFLFIYSRYGHIFFVSQLYLTNYQYRRLDKHKDDQIQYLYKLFIMSILYV